MINVFLGGTCGNNHWREGFIEKLVALGVPRETIFNPVVADWNEEAQAREDEAKKSAKYALFYLASPMDDNLKVSLYSWVEALLAFGYDSKYSGQPVIVFDFDGYGKHALKAAAKAAADIKAEYGHGPVFNSLDKAALYIAGNVVPFLE